VIFGRPINLWLGLVTASLAFAQVLIVTLVPDVDPTTVATVLGAFGGLLAVVIALVANQPPTISSGDTVKVVTPPGQDNRTVTVQ
jgi:hypothetical protein